MIFGLQTKNEAYISTVWRGLRLSPKELRDLIEKLELLYRENTGEYPNFKSDYVINKNGYGQDLIYLRGVTAFHKELKDNGWEKKEGK